jgi:hypothetical protein
MCVEALFCLACRIFGRRTGATAPKNTHRTESSLRSLDGALHRQVLRAGQQIAQILPELLERRSSGEKLSEGFAWQIPQDRRE